MIELYKENNMKENKKVSVHISQNIKKQKRYFFKVSDYFLKNFI